VTTAWSSSPDNARADSIREAARYSGTRITMPCRIGKARSTLALDINVGDPITPGATLIDFPQILDPDPIRLYGYPVETVLAEKLTTMVSLGDLNTRERGWADVWRLSGAHDLDGTTIHAALINTATYRGISLQPLSQVIGTLRTRRQRPYAAWLARQAATGGYPADFGVLVDAVITFADPPLDGRSAGKSEAADRPIRSALDIEHLAVSEHHRRLIRTCWQLGGMAEYDGLNLRRWAHMLGFRGHFLTKSKAYSTTFTAIRGERRAYRQAEALDRFGLDAESVVVVNSWTWTGTGYRTDAERELALAIAERVRGDRTRKYEKEIGG
jgi:replication initiator protein RepSA/nucleotidyltransferase AbiEii toxin of type IV toxin-antitoxin system